MSSWNAGKALSAEHRRHISEALRGKPRPTGRVVSEATRQRISEANRGQIPWTTGRHLSESTRKKIGDANRGRKQSPETARRLRDANLGRTPWNKGLSCPRPSLLTKAEIRSRRNAKVAKWHRDNPERGRALKANARARRRERMGDVPVPGSFLVELLKTQAGLCRYCSSELGRDKHLDHRIPLARGGKHVPENLCWACPDCNLRKSTKTEREFLALIDRNAAIATIQERAAA